MHLGEHSRMSSKCLTLAASIHRPTLTSSFASSRSWVQLSAITDLQANTGTTVLHHTGSLFKTLRAALCTDR